MLSRAGVCQQVSDKVHELQKSLVTVVQLYEHKKP